MHKHGLKTHNGYSRTPHLGSHDNAVGMQNPVAMLVGMSKACTVFRPLGLFRINRDSCEHHQALHISPCQTRTGRSGGRGYSLGLARKPFTHLVCMTYRTSSTRAITPAAIGAAAEVPLKLLVQYLVVVVTSAVTMFLSDLPRPLLYVTANLAAQSSL